MADSIETKQAKFTPGPWVAKGRYIGTKNHMSAVGECRDINGNWCDDAKACADARLIAAAPDLLATLKCLVAHCKGLDRFEGNPINQALADARTAIAKAEG